MYPYLFSPIRINRLEIKNRIAYPALGLAYSHDRRLNERYFNYFREIARGGAGVVTVGPVGVDVLGAGFLVGFGCRSSGCCTSGHAIMRLSNLQWPSLVATCCFMVGGFVMANLILPFILKL